MVYHRDGEGSLSSEHKISHSKVCKCARMKIEKPHGSKLLVTTELGTLFVAPHQCQNQKWPHARKDTSISRQAGTQMMEMAKAMVCVRAL